MNENSLFSFAKPLFPAYFPAAQSRKNRENRRKSAALPRWISLLFITTPPCVSCFLYMYFNIFYYIYWLIFSLFEI